MSDLICPRCHCPMSSPFGSFHRGSCPECRHRLRQGSTSTPPRRHHAYQLPFGGPTSRLVYDVVRLVVLALVALLVLHAILIFWSCMVSHIEAGAVSGLMSA